MLGNYSLRSLGTPLLNSVIYDSTKKIPNPDDQDTVKKTVYDKWLASFPNTEKTLPRYMYIIFERKRISCRQSTILYKYKHHRALRPLHIVRIADMGSGSDYAPFIKRVGLPCLDIRYTYNSVR